MEVRKATSSQITEPQIDKKSEVTKKKSTVLNQIADSFENESSQSSSSDHSSSASSEPEKKAGQITGGILIKQMTAARIGETNAKSGESSGKKELSPEQQSRVSNSNPQKENLKPSFFLQDARSKDEDRKNSGLQPPFASSKNADSEQQSKVNQSRELAKDLIGKDTRVQDGSQKDFSNDPVVNGTRLNEAVQDAIETRQQDAAALGGQTGRDRLTDAADPTSKGPGQQSSSPGKEGLESKTDDLINLAAGAATLLGGPSAARLEVRS